MKKLMAAMVCALPFILGSTVYARTYQHPDEENQANSNTTENQTSNQTDTPDSDAQGTADAGTTDSHAEGTADTDTTDSRAEGTAETDTANPGGPDSMTFVAPAQPATPSTTEPESGHNRSASGDATGAEPRARDDQGVR